MSTAQYRCKNQDRLKLLDANPAVNGIDYLEVSSDQQTLQVFFAHALTSPLDLKATNVVILGGTRIRAATLELYPDGSQAILPGELKVVSIAASGRRLSVQVSQPGDYSTYTLMLISSLTDLQPPSGYDRQLSEVDFSFKLDCPSDFDCAPQEDCPPEKLPEPTIDYLAKDFSSFRHLMLDRISALMPGWQETNLADTQIALVELLAYAGDRLSYYQDAVATEAYLGTARQRPSLRRHARLLDYRMHDGCNARAWVCLEVQKGGVSPVQVHQKDQFLTRGLKDTPTVSPADLDGLLRSESPEVFEALHDFTPTYDRNRIRLHTWGDTSCCLPRGATRATLVRTTGLDLKVNDVLVFEEVCSPTTGLESDADPAHRHAVRLLTVDNSLQDPLVMDPDTLGPLQLSEVTWRVEDALPFPLCISAILSDDSFKTDLSVARGNVLLVDHGQRVKGEKLPAILQSGPYRPRLKFGPVARQTTVLVASGPAEVKKPAAFDPTAPARNALQTDPRASMAAVVLAIDGLDWSPVFDLLASGRFSPEFVVEVENDGTAVLRFGDDVLGMKPTPGAVPSAEYRVGNGTAGNVGAGSIARLVSDDSRISRVWNPLPAAGGVDPEEMAQVRQKAPQAFRVQQRAVTDDDYVEISRRRADVQNASAELRWTGSWYTAYVTVDRKDGLPVEASFDHVMLDYLDTYRLAGYDLEISPPVYVPLDIAFDVCVKPGYFKSNVRQTLLKVFSNADLPDGTRGFFHPDNFSFGQSVYLSKLYETAMKVEGVDSLQATRLQRWGQQPNQELETGVLRPASTELIRLDNDPNFPENGKIDFIMGGGL